MSCNPVITKILEKNLGFPVTYAEHQEDHGGFFTTDSEYLQIINLAKVRNITLEQQYNKQRTHPRFRIG